MTNAARLADILHDDLGFGEIGFFFMVRNLVFISNYKGGNNETNPSALGDSRQADTLTM
jgi:hypothetical protein